MSRPEHVLILRDHEKKRQFILERSSGRGAEKEIRDLTFTSRWELCRSDEEIDLSPASQKPSFRSTLLGDKVTSFEYNQPALKFTDEIKTPS